MGFPAVPLSGTGARRRLGRRAPSARPGATRTIGAPLMQPALDEGKHDGDPHEDPRREPGGALQKAFFLHTGLVIDVCDGQPYRTNDHPESGGEFVCNPWSPGRRDRGRGRLARAHSQLSAAPPEFPFTLG